MSVRIDRMAFWRIDAAAVVVALCAGFGVYSLVVGPALKARAQERARAEELGPQEALREQQENSLRRAVDRLAAAQHELEASPLRLEPVSQINHRHAKVTELAAETGLNLDQVTPGEQTPSSDAVVVALRLTGRGEFPAAVLFMARLHSEFPDMAVNGFRLSANPAPGEVKGTFVFDLAWYAASGDTEADRRADVPLQ